MFEQIFINLLSALAGAGIAYAYQNWIIPGAIELSSEDLKLKSHYIGTLTWSTTHRHKISLRIKKLGHKVSGSLEFIEGENTGKEYLVTGYYKLDKLTFIYRAKNPGSSSQGSGTFQRLEDGELFDGYFAYTRKSENRVESIPCQFRAV